MLALVLTSITYVIRGMDPAKSVTWVVKRIL